MLSGGEKNRGAGDRRRGERRGRDDLRRAEQQGGGGELNR